MDTGFTNQFFFSASASHNTQQMLVHFI